MEIKVFKSGICGMPRSRKPTAELERSGAFAKNPQRKRCSFPAPKDVGPLGMLFGITEVLPCTSRVPQFRDSCESRNQ